MLRQAVRFFFQLENPLVMNAFSGLLHIYHKEIKLNLLIKLVIVFCEIIYPVNSVNKVTLQSPL